MGTDGHNLHNNGAFLPWHRGFILGQGDGRLDSSSENIDGESKDAGHSIWTNGTTSGLHDSVHCFANNLWHVAISKDGPMYITDLVMETTYTVQIRSKDDTENGFDLSAPVTVNTLEQCQGACYVVGREHLKDVVRGGDMMKKKVAEDESDTPLTWAKPKNALCDVVTSSGGRTCSRSTHAWLPVRRYPRSMCVVGT